MYAEIKIKDDKLIETIERLENAKKEIYECYRTLQVEGYLEISEEKPDK